jgi:hypothetical protein
MAHKKKERSRKGRKTRVVRAVWAQLPSPEAIDEAFAILLRTDAEGGGQQEPVDKPAENPRI